jgi:hypothetical protein
MALPISSSFFDFAENHIQNLKKNNNIGNWRKYGSVLKKLKIISKQPSILISGQSGHGFTKPLIQD